MIIKIFGKEIELKQSSIIILIIGAIIVFYLLNATSPEEKNEEPIIVEASVEESNLATSAPSPIPEKVKVYVYGKVKRPGVYTLLKGSVVEDALNLAGGPKRDAWLGFNLAWEINENVMIRVPSKKQKNKVQIISASANGDQSPLSGDSLGDEKEGGKININSASQEQLMEIPGVGESTSAKIIEYRKERKFESLEDIMNVSGIGEKKFEDMKAFICV